MFNFAVDELEVVGSTPIRRMKGPGVETTRDRTLTADEIRALWPRFTALGYPYGPALQLAFGDRPATAGNRNNALGATST
jgi:hypothetical protein